MQPALRRWPRCGGVPRSTGSRFVWRTHATAATTTEPPHTPGWLVLARCPLPELRSTATVLRHATGALFVDIASRDEHAYFSVAFRTGVLHDRGTPHVLEHVALCGSEAFDVRDPFHAMSTRSLYTDMNAATGADHTSYYFSTANAADYVNLRTVFLDAVFRPLLRESDFLAEGVRLEPADDAAPQTSPLALRGVVYNEMQGHAASAAEALGHAVYRALLPGTCYAASAGGDPRAIPDLTHAELVAFHRARYAPANALFVAYGALPCAPTLHAVGVALDGAAAARAQRAAATTEGGVHHVASVVAGVDSGAAVDGTAASQLGLPSPVTGGDFVPPPTSSSNAAAVPQLPPHGVAAPPPWAGDSPCAVRVHADVGAEQQQPLLRVALPPDADDGAGLDEADGAAATTALESRCGSGAAEGVPVEEGRRTVLRAWRIEAATTEAPPGAEGGHAAVAPAPFRSCYGDLVLRLAADLLLAGTHSPLYTCLIASGLATGYAPGSGADTAAGDATVLVLGGVGVRAADEGAVDAAIVAALHDAVRPRGAVSHGGGEGGRTAAAVELGPHVNEDGALVLPSATSTTASSTSTSTTDDDDPFSAARIEAALHAVEFGLRAPSPALGATLAGIVTERWAAAGGPTPHTPEGGGTVAVGAAHPPLDVSGAAASAAAATAAVALLEPLRVRDLVQRLRAETVGLGLGLSNPNTTAHAGTAGGATAAARGSTGDSGAPLRAALAAATLGSRAGSRCVRIVGAPTRDYLVAAQAAEAARLVTAEAVWTPTMREAAAAAARGRDAAAAGDGGADALPLLPLSAIPRTAPDLDAGRVLHVGGGGDACAPAAIPHAVAAAPGNNGVATLRLLFNIALPTWRVLPPTAIDGTARRPWSSAASPSGAGSHHGAGVALAPHLHAWLPLFAATALSYGTRTRAPAAWDLATRRSLGRLSASIVTASPSAVAALGGEGGGDGTDARAPLYGLLLEATWLTDGRGTPDALSLLGEVLAEGAAATAQLFVRDRAVLERSLRGVAVDAAQGAADAGAAYAASAAAAWLNPITALRELHAGRTQARFLIECGRSADRSGEGGSDVDAAAAAFQDIAASLFVRRAGAVSAAGSLLPGDGHAPLRALLTVDPEHEDSAAAAVAACLDVLPERGAEGVEGVAEPAPATHAPPVSAPPRLLLRSPAHVHALGLALPAPAWGSAEHAHLSLGLSALAAARLHAAVRTRGGAYDVAARVGTADAALITTGDDPAPLASLRAIVHAASAAVSSRGGLCDADVRGAKLAAAAELDAPQPPSSRGISRLLYGVDRVARQAHRDALLGASAADVRRALEAHVVVPLAAGDFGAAVVGPLDEASDADADDALAPPRAVGGSGSGADPIAGLIGADRASAGLGRRRSHEPRDDRRRRKGSHVDASRGLWVTEDLI